MPKNFLEDGSGVYLVAAIVSIHPLERKAHPRDTSIPAAVHTAISTAGGQTHHTNIPYDQAREAVLAHWQPQLRPVDGNNKERQGDNPG